MKTLRLVFLAVALALVAYGLFGEAHVVRALDEGAEPAVIGGADYTSRSTSEEMMLRGGLLYDVFSLRPEAASDKTCKT